MISGLPVATSGNTAVGSWSGSPHRSISEVTPRSIGKPRCHKNQVCSETFHNKFEYSLRLFPSPQECCTGKTISVIIAGPKCRYFHFKKSKVNVFGVPGRSLRKGYKGRYYVRKSTRPDCRATAVHKGGMSHTAQWLWVDCREDRS